MVKSLMTRIFRSLLTAALARRRVRRQRSDARAAKGGKPHPAMINATRLKMHRVAGALPKSEGLQTAATLAARQLGAATYD